ncbi:carboxypeptidase-like regulatory domain-containing protein [Polaribacter glomeratus]|uniref:TonB-dependent receptor n=1 Tax=Polaribacter glomeratus TaxID=102 RepID=A0A2S7WVK5_9FLAO|nr:carboxypeptidase-like regulatory domain-containing protein [Polaribacter glomeratus]PQJ81332.1 hypothetical protein BTO16_01495 [Polaribacter glomeratus]TXD64054.1 hypothetical protein ESX12_16485 [Polaribacter glomeratus]
MKYEIKIPKPCSEKWNEMTTTEKGAFCLNCNKEVFNFTEKSNYQLSRILDSNQKFCGKFKPEQLNIEISSLQNNKYSKTGLLFGITTLLSLTTPIFSQNKTTEKIKITQLNSVNKDTVFNKKLKDSLEIKGHVFDENGGLPGVNILLKGYSNKLETDFDGNFTITIKKTALDKNLILMFYYLGFEMQEIQINHETEYLNVKMIENTLVIEEIIMGEVVIINKQNIFRKIVNIFRRKY